MSSVALHILSTLQLNFISHIIYTLCYVYVKINYYDTKYLGQH
jgi:hypothetical protein